MGKKALSYQPLAIRAESNARQHQRSPSLPAPASPATRKKQAEI